MITEHTIARPSVADDNQILIGFNRTSLPPDTKYVDAKGVTCWADALACPCGENLFFVHIVREHWQLGHFDTPVYATKQEVIDRLIDKNASWIGNLIIELFCVEPTDPLSAENPGEAKS